MESVAIVNFERAFCDKPVSMSERQEDQIYKLLLEKKVMNQINQVGGVGGPLKKTHLLIFAFFVAFQFREATKKYFLNGSAIMGGGLVFFIFVAI